MTNKLTVEQKIAQFEAEFGYNSAEMLAEPTDNLAARKIEVRKPKASEWCRASTLPQHQLKSPILTYEDETLNGKVLYLVMPKPEIVSVMENVSRAKHFAVYTNRDGVTFLNPIGLDASNSWNRSAQEAFDSAKRVWTLQTSLKKAGKEHYQVRTSESIQQVPVFRNESVVELLMEAFGDNVISSVDHPIVRKLEGLE